MRRNIRNQQIPPRVNRQSIGINQLRQRYRRQQNRNTKSKSRQSHLRSCYSAKKESSAMANDSSNPATDPKGIRTPVTAVKGRCPGPLDDGAIAKQSLLAQERAAKDTRLYPPRNRVCHRRPGPALLQL